MPFEQGIDIGCLIEARHEPLQHEDAFDQGRLKPICIPSRLECLTVPVFLIALDVSG